MKDGAFVVRARCALCLESGLNRFKVIDQGDGGAFWSSMERFAIIADSQRCPDSLELGDPYSHIPLMLTCGRH